MCSLQVPACFFKPAETPAAVFCLEAVDAVMRDESAVQMQVFVQVFVHLVDVAFPENPSKTFICPFLLLGREEFCVRVFPASFDTAKN